MLGNERTPAMKFINDIFKEYYYEIDKNNVRYDIVTISVPKHICASNLGNMHVQTRYDQMPPWRVDNKEIEVRVDGEDKVLAHDVSIALFLIDVMKQDVEKMEIQVKLTKNVQAIMREAGAIK